MLKFTHRRSHSGIGNAALTPEQRSDAARKAARAARETGLFGFENFTPERRSEISRKGALSRTPEQKIEIGRRAARRTNELGLGAFQVRTVCPHCRLESTVAILKRWHFDNCPDKIRLPITRPTR
jgi:general stress protein YciG